jgi:sugar-specific transcriptional regulator TrmB
METETLRRLGLEEKEIKVYLVLLKFGNITASKIAKETSIDRATCYRYLDSLIKKGLVSYAIENNIKYFKAAHPEKILEDLQEKESEYKKILPELVKLTNISKKETNVEVYEGKDGLKTVLRQVIRDKKDHLVLGDEGNFTKLMPIFFKQFIKECERNKIKEKVLCSKKVFKRIKRYDYKYSTTKALHFNYVAPTTTVIYEGKIILFNWSKPYNAIIISNIDMAKAYTNYFNILWKTAKQ